MKYTGLILLALWLIAQGLKFIFNLYFPREQEILPLVNMAAGVFLVLCLLKIKRGEISLFFLGVWAILQSSLLLFDYSFNYSHTLVHLLGIVAGILLIFKV